MLKATIIGNLGGDPEMRYSASGNPLLRFNVASNYRTRTPEGEYQDRVEWVRVTVTGNRAETLSQYLQKGSKVYVEGRLEARPWTDQQGNIRAGLEVFALEVQFMSPRNEDDGGQGGGYSRQSAAAGTNRASGGNQQRGQQGAQMDDDELEDLPF
jgi:single-strand DNA-binding protein